MGRAQGFTAAFAIFLSIHPVFAYADGQSAPEQPASPEGLGQRIQALLTQIKASLRPIRGGTFEMGDWGNESGGRYDLDTHSRPVHKVTLDGFSMMAYKVSYDDFDVFTDATGKERVDMDSISVRDRGPKRPAGVSWYGAKAYCQWLGV
jgi:formylglycine-generating enzyme required for sulfatase activity